MENIKKGEWIRTNSGIVDRIKDIIKTQGDRKLIAFEKMNTYKSDIGLKKWLKTHSKNKIDIVEVGDYVNGILVKQLKVLTNEVMKERYLAINNKLAFYNFNIKDIVTHEQFESMKYDFEEVKDANKMQ